MSKEDESLVKEILETITKEEAKTVPFDSIFESMTKNHSESAVNRAIEHAIERFLIDKVLDYAAEKWNLPTGEQLWHLKILRPEEQDELRSYSPVDIALLRLLQRQDNTERRGEIRSDEAREILKEAGFSEKELRFLWIEDRIDHNYEYVDDEPIEWCRLIPEDEKTEEFKQAMEEAQREWEEKDAIRTRMADISDVTSWLIEYLAKFPEGLPLSAIEKYITEKYSWIDFSDLLDNALWSESIVQVPNPEEGDEVWYKAHPQYTEEDYYEGDPSSDSEE